MSHVVTPAASSRLQPTAIVLLSGGLDSTTCLAMALHEGFIPVALSFRYGQRHAIELKAAASISESTGVEHVIVDIDLGAFGGSSLTDSAAEIPLRDSLEDTPQTDNPEIPSTYVPARNTVFLSLALALAEVRGATAIFIGVNAVDYSGYPDCRPAFIEAFQRLANLATKAGVEGCPVTIHAPLSGMSKAEIIRRGIELGVDYSMTTSCYGPTPDGYPCGRCDSCLLRARGFAQAGMRDPALVAAETQ